MSGSEWPAQAASVSSTCSPPIGVLELLAVEQHRALLLVAVDHLTLKCEDAAAHPVDDGVEGSEEMRVSLGREAGACVGRGSWLAWSPTLIT